MAIIKPFKSVRYHSPKVDTIAKFLAPPYDVISELERDELYDRSENNIVRIDFPKDPPKGDKYEQSAALLDKWEKEELLVVESRPAIYVLEDYFIDWHGYRRIRRGFIAVLKVEDFNKGTVFPHEKTFAKHKRDRMDMLKATQAQFNPVFAFYSDGENTIRPVLKNVVNHNLPDWNFRFDDGATRTLWTVTDHRFIDQIVEGMKSRKIFIADGHHRYETALEYAKMKDKELGTEGSDAAHQYALMYFVCTEDEGLSILATHRLLKDIPGYDGSKVLEKLKISFDIKEIGWEDALNSLDEDPDALSLVIQLGKGKFYKLHAKESAIQADSGLKALDDSVRGLNVSICDEMVVKPIIGDLSDILNHIKYEIDPNKVNEAVESGKFDMAVYLAPIPIERLEKVASAGQVMPHKSTYFYPKLVTGLVIYRHIH